MHKDNWKGDGEDAKTKNLLTHAMAKLDEDTVINLVKKGLEQGLDPHALLQEVIAGMSKVGELYYSGQYFLGDMIVASDIFQVMLTLMPTESYNATMSCNSPIVFGTVEGDIHDIGKNIAIGILRGNGFKVIDLGVDVPPEKFVEAMRQNGSQLICLSGLITQSYHAMKETIDLITATACRSEVKVVIGGLVNETVKNYTGADYWVTDCSSVSELFKDIIQSKK